MKRNSLGETATSIHDRYRGFFIYYSGYWKYLLECFILAIVLQCVFLLLGPLWANAQLWFPFVFFCVIVLMTSHFASLLFIAIMEIAAKQESSCRACVDVIDFDWNYQFTSWREGSRVELHSSQYVLTSSDGSIYRVYQNDPLPILDSDSSYRGLELQIAYLPKSRVVLKMAFPPEEKTMQRHNRQEFLERKRLQDEFLKAFGGYFD